VPLQRPITIGRIGRKDAAATGTPLLCPYVVAMGHPRAFKRAEGCVPTRVGQVREGQDGHTAGVLVYVEDVDGAGRLYDWLLSVYRSLINC